MITEGHCRTFPNLSLTRTPRTPVESKVLTQSMTPIDLLTFPVNVSILLNSSLKVTSTKRKHSSASETVYQEIMPTRRTLLSRLDLTKTFKHVRQRHAESSSNFAGATEHDPNNGNNKDTVEPEADDGYAQLNELHPVQKRKRPSDLFDEEEEDSSREDQKKFVATALPWAIQDAIAPIELSANLQRT